MMLRYAVLAAFAALLAALPAPAEAEEKRLALVLSNQDYSSDIGKLSLTHADGDQVAAALGDVGFKVTRGRDLDSEGMDRILAGFEKDITDEAAGGDEVIVFFYASMHGAAVEVDGRPRNFLLPVHEVLTAPGQVIRKAFRLDQIISGFAATKAKAIVIVSDACRNNMGVSYSKGGDKGFVTERGGPGVLIAYATEQGATTPDDGVFATALASEIRAKGQKASVAMLYTVEHVARLRSWEAQPFMTSGGLPEGLCFNGCSAEDGPTDVPVLIPSGLVQRADAAAPTLAATTRGYIASYDLPKYVVVVTALAKFRGTPPPSGTRSDESEFKFSGGVSSAQIAFTRYGTDYLIVFSCRGTKESDICLSKDEAVEFAESMYVAQQGSH